MGDDLVKGKVCEEMFSGSNLDMKDKFPTAKVSKFLARVIFLVPETSVRRRTKFKK